jgi:hypothetical protein
MALPRLWLIVLCIVRMVDDAQNDAHSVLKSMESADIR